MDGGWMVDGWWEMLIASAGSMQGSTAPRQRSSSGTVACSTHLSPYPPPYPLPPTLPPSHPLSPTPSIVPYHLPSFPTTLHPSTSNLFPPHIIMLRSLFRTVQRTSRGLNTHVTGSRSTEPWASAPSLVVASHAMPGPSKKRSEDASVVSPSTNTLAVLDGVGGWSRVPDANPAEFSARLADKVAEAAVSSWNGGKGDNGGRAWGDDAHRVVRLAQEAGDAMDAESIHLGSATLCLACLGPQNDGAVHVYNLGDSEARVLARRDGESSDFEIVDSTQNGPSSQIVFNMPYQFGRNGNEIGDGSLFSFAANPGDLVLLTTDGVHDNLFDPELESLVSECLGQADLATMDEVELKDLLDTAAMRLVVTARYFSESDRPSPFSNLGGKPDDTTVVLAVVRP